MGVHLTKMERFKIEAFLELKLSKSEIARRLNKSYSAVCREIKRGMVWQTINPFGFYKDVYIYKADYAQIIHEERCTNKGPKRILKEDTAFKKDLIQKIKKGYSPEVALLLLEEKYGNVVCFKTVYNSIERGDFNLLSLKDLTYKKVGTKYKKKVGKVFSLNRRSIEERPKSITSRKEFGHWELDSVLSGYSSSSKAALFVLTERLTRYSFVYKMSCKTQDMVKKCLDNLEQEFKHHFPVVFKSITMDNGMEFINQSMIENSILNCNSPRTVAYYCHAYSAFERGSNENYNRFIRRFIPKSSNIERLSESFIERVVNFINNYPRKMFAFSSSRQLYDEQLSLLA